MKTPTTIADVFLRKLRGLGRDESGVAFIMTLAMVLPLVIMVTLSAGIGDMVRRKIRLQNSVDMAARSAAVVQADLLSKMAVVNRVTAWTYANYCRRRMDWLMGAFCKRCCDEWRKKRIECMINAETRGQPTPNPAMSSFGVGWAVPPATAQDGPMVAIYMPFFTKFLNDGRKAKNMVDSAMAMANTRGSALATLKNDIKSDYKILKGTDAAWKRLRSAYQTEIRKAAVDILKANLNPMGRNSWGNYGYQLHFNDSHLDRIFKKIGGSAADEETLFEMADLSPYSKSSFTGRNVLGDGADTWFRRDSSADHPKRTYHEGTQFMKAEFEWGWYAWGLDEATIIPTPHKPTAFKADYDHGKVTVKASEISEVISSNNGIIHNDVPVTAYTLKDAFWTKDGSITVSAVWETPNFLSFMDPEGGKKNALNAKPKSMWSALNPNIAGSQRPTDIMAIASARAAYKRASRGESRRNRIKKTRYCLSWTEDKGKQRWNLCETDWDGVLLPSVASWSKWSGEGATVRATSNILYDRFGKGDPRVSQLVSPRISQERRTSKLLDWNKLGRLLIH